MVRPVVALSALWLFSVCGCSGDPPAGAGPTPPAGAGTGSGATGASAGTGGSGNTGAADAGGVASAAGSVAGGSAGTGSSVPADQQGVQEEPGTEGDGEYAQPEPYEQPPETIARDEGAPAGTVYGNTSFTSTGVYPGLIFQYLVYVPAQYQPGKPAALMVFQDGKIYLGHAEATFDSPLLFDNLIHRGEIPVTIAVFIQPGTEDGVYTYPDESPVRSLQYDTPDDSYTRFLTDEFLPNAIFNQYDVVDDPEGWMIGGHSSGGVCAFMVGWYGDQFRKILAHNASFSNTDGVFPGAIADTDPPRPLRVYLSSGPNDLGGWFEANNAAAAALEAKGYHYRYLTGSGIHYPPMQAVADYPDALRWMWRGYSLPWYED